MEELQSLVSGALWLACQTTLLKLLERTQSPTGHELMHFLVCSSGHSPFPHRNPNPDPSPEHDVTFSIPMFLEVLVRELQNLGEALREREDELGACSERLEKAVSDAKSERAR